MDTATRQARGRDRTQASRTLSIARYATLAVAVALPLCAIGAVTDATLLAAVIAAAVAAGSFGFRVSDASRAVRLVALGFAIQLGVSLLQLVPLPPGLLRVISPYSAAVWGPFDATVGGIGTYRPISIDPAATQFALVTIAACGAIFLAASTSLRAPRGRRHVISALLIAIALWELTGIMHAVLRIDLYGTFRSPAETALAMPLLNPNHAGAVAAAAPPLAVGLALEEREGSRRILLITMAVVSVAVALLTLSRSTFAVLLLELSIGALLFLRRARKSARDVLPYVALAAAVGTGLAIYVGAGALGKHFGNRDTSKLTIVSAGARLIREAPFLGTGRGTFGVAFGPFEPMVDPPSRFSHAESLPVQLSTDLGVVAALAVVGCFAAATYLGARAMRRRASILGALIALVGLAVHDLLDFSLEFAGAGAVAAVLLAVVTTRSEASSSRVVPIATVPRSAFAAAVLAAGLLLLPNFQRRLDDDLRRFATKLEATGKIPETSEVLAAAARHPADAFLATAAGISMHPEPAAAAHLVLAIQRGPQRAHGHFWLARWFLAAGRSPQAFGEYRETLRLGPSMSKAVVRDLLNAGAPVAELAALPPAAAEIAATELSTSGRTADAEKIDDTMLANAPNAIGPRLRRIARLRAAGRVADALSEASILVGLEPHDAAGYLAAAELEQDDQTAESWLERGAIATADDPRILEALVRRQGRRLGTAAIQGLVQRLKQALASRSEDIARVYLACADAELARKAPERAIAALLEGAQLAKDPRPLLEKAAATAEATGQLALSRATWQRLADAYPDNLRYRAEVIRLLARP